MKSLLAIAGTAVALSLTAQMPETTSEITPFGFDTCRHVAVNPEEWMDTALLRPHERDAEDPLRYERLTDDDYREVAEELGVEVAAIRAVIDIEAGSSGKGFWAPAKPLINFDLTMFRKFAPRNGLSVATAQKAAPVIFAKPNVSKYGSQQAGQQARLDAARELNSGAGIESTFWGLFQIGGFNWKKLGFDSPEEFAEAMSHSERAQLEIFARFLKAFNLVDYVRNRQWLNFALKYNGPKAKSRGYHTRMAAAYNRYKSLEKKKS